MKKGIFTMLLFLVLPLSCITAQNEMFKALFIFNFTKNVEWPAEMRQGDFVIKVLGDSPIIAELQKVTAGKKVGQQNIVISKADNLNDAGQCHIFYLPPGKSGDFSQVLPKVEGKPVLLITDKEGLAQQGACINFVVVSGKLNFEINKSRFQKQKLQMSSSLTNLGIVI